MLDLKELGMYIWDRAFKDILDDLLEGEVFHEYQLLNVRVNPLY